MCLQKGASTWLTTLLIVDYGFALHKGAIYNAVCLRYIWCPNQLPSHFVLAEDFR